MKKLKLLTGSESSQTGKGRLRKGIQIALASTLLVSGMANAVLRDHGPIRITGTTTLPADFFPDWYRETQESGGMAIGQCIYQDDAGSGPLCLTSTADALPDRFAGNIGDEAFYATADIIIPITGGNLSWIGHLEMAYLTADGSPPATRTVNDPNPQEVVFSRERIRIDLPTTVDNSCAGTYTIRTPFAVHTFDMEEGGRALFYTDDQTAIPGDYSAALKGHAGPFLKWDVGLDNVNPVSAANPAVTFTPPVGTVRKYIGDPNIEHLFVGSTLPAGPGHLDKVFNNYVEITPPANCNLGAGNGVPLFNDLAAISGPIWDLPIQDPIVVNKATYVRDTNTAALDVWVEGPKNQNIALTASSSASQHLPSVKMQEESVSGAPTGRYHTHLEFDKDEAIPTQVTAINMTSNPVARASSAVVDSVVITKSVFDPNTRKLCISAHSGDLTSPQPLSLNAPAYGAFTAPTGTCPGVDSNDLVLEKDLDDFAPDNRIPPEGVLVRSDKGGSETSQPVSLTGVSDATVLLGAVNDSFDNIQGTGNTTLDLTGAAFGVAPALVKTTASADTTPGNFRIVVVSQPVNNLGEVVGTIAAAASGGNVTYTAEEGMDASELTFYYAIQDTTNNAVTNVAQVDLSVDKTVPPPVGVQDLQGVLRTSPGSVVKVLANDVTGLSNTPIDIASIQIVTAPALGTATVNLNGTITYVPVGQGGAANNTQDSFTYTVANTAGARSLPITVRVALKTAPEAVAFQRVRWNGSRWDIRFTSSYAGPAGAITLAPPAQCALTANGAGGQTGNIGGPVAPGAGTNAYVNVANSPAAVGNNYTVTCTTASGGVGSRTGQL